MLYTLNLYSAICQLYLPKSEKNLEKKNFWELKEAFIY